jgi:hypothetical protein
MNIALAAHSTAVKKFEKKKKKKNDKDSRAKTCGTITFLLIFCGGKWVMLG